MTPHLDTAATTPRATRHLRERRRYARVRFAGEIAWNATSATGFARVIDLSPGGVALAVPQRQAVHFKGPVRLRMQMTPEVCWDLTQEGRVTNIVPLDLDNCRVCISF